MHLNSTLLGSGSSGAKIILIGEHSVVYGNPAIAVPFNGVETKVSIYKTDSHITIDCMYHKGYLKDGARIILGLEKLIFFVLNKLNIKSYGLHFKIDSNIISQRGLGSSASVSVAIVRAIYNSFNIDLDDITLIELAMYAEKIHHTNPSGLDVYTLVYQKPIWYEKNIGFKVININFDGTIMIIDTGMMSQTRLAVEHVASLKRTNEKLVLDEFNKITKLTFKALEALENNQVSTLGDIMLDTQVCLEKIEVSNDTINRFIKILKSSSVLGAKLTGGGMGGCIIALTNDISDAIKIRDILIRQEISNVWIYPLKELNNK